MQKREIWFFRLSFVLAVVVTTGRPHAALAQGLGSTKILPHIGSQFQESVSIAGEHQHYFAYATTTIPASGSTFGATDLLYVWIYLVPGDLPAEIMVQYYGSDGTWNHRAYWGANDLSSWGNGTSASMFQVSNFIPPNSGGWTRLSVAAAQLGLTGLSANGMAFTLYGGFAYWDDAGYLKNGTGSENVWVGSGTPSGATLYADGGDSWTWLTTAYKLTSAHTGSFVQKSLNVTGLHQHWFNGATGANEMSVGSSDYLYAWIYIDPIAMPSEVMLQWATTSGLLGRAYWGANDISWSGSLVYQGPIPSAAVGGWYRLQVAASTFGLNNQSISSMAWTLYNGAAYWDDAGRLAGGSSGPEYVWVDEGPPSGVTLYASGGDSW